MLIRSEQEWKHHAPSASILTTSIRLLLRWMKPSYISLIHKRTNSRWNEDTLIRASAGSFVCRNRLHLSGILVEQSLQFVIESSKGLDIRLILPSDYNRFPQMNTIFKIRKLLRRNYRSSKEMES